MKVNWVLEVAAKMFAGVKAGALKPDPKLAALDRGVLTVALLVAALDGTILPEEFAAFRQLARDCRGGTDENVRSLLDRALKEAGYLLAMAQVGVYSEKDRLSAFAAAAQAALPVGFADGSETDVRRAFALWVVVGASDGTFSGIERSAVEALAGFLADVRSAFENSRIASVGVNMPLSHEYVTELPPLKSEPLLEPDFLVRAEKIALDLAIPEKRPEAESALAELVG